MTKKQVPASAMALSPKDREMLAEELWLSLAETTMQQVHHSWAVEIEKRLRQLDCGDAETLPADGVMREARKLVRRKRTA